MITIKFSPIVCLNQITQLVYIALLFTVISICDVPLLLSEPVPDTGQIRSYTDIFGEDADYQINPKFFTKLDLSGNPLPQSAKSWAMVQDNVTGLIWEVKTNDNSIHDKDNLYYWYSLNAEINSGNPGAEGDGNHTQFFIQKLNELQFGGFSDWRMPTIKELASLIDIEQYGLTINGLFFPNTVSSNYWSSTSYRFDASFVWALAYNDISAGQQLKSTQCYIRAVRGGVSNVIHDMVYNGDGTVSHISTGLMWQQDAFTTVLPWAKAISSCEALQFAGHDDWRLPNIEELRSIADYSRYDQSVDPRFFPDTQSSYYWSSTSNASNLQKAWSIYFKDGNDFNRDKSTPYLVRAVRGGQHIDGLHMTVSNPKQGDMLTIGSLISIKWDATQIQGYVNIIMSRDGGKTGSFDVIDRRTENDGVYEWTVTGPAAASCMLMIIPENEPDRFAQVSFFSIDEVKTYYIQIDPIVEMQQYWIYFIEKLTYYEKVIPVNWQFSNPSAVSLEGNHLTAMKDASVSISASYNGYTCKDMLYLKSTFDQWEKEPNNSIAYAMPIDAGTLIGGELLDNDEDHFAFFIDSDALVKLFYTTQSSTSDSIIEIRNGANSLMAKSISTNGSTISLIFGLPKGPYTIRILSAGDIDPDNHYFLSFQKIEPLSSNTQTRINVGDTYEGRLYHYNDTRMLTIDTQGSQKVTFEFIPASSVADYRLTLWDQENNILEKLYTQGEIIRIEHQISSGYRISIAPGDRIDASRTFALHIANAWFMESEPNDSFENATQLYSFGKIMGVLAYTYDVDFYTIQIDSSVFLSIEFSNSESIKPFLLSIYRESDNQLIEQREINQNKDAYFYLGLTPGQYYFKISGNILDPEPYYPYTLILQPSDRFSAETESNNTMQFATPIYPNQEIVGKIVDKQDIDYYGFELTEESSFYVDFIPSSKNASYVITLSDMSHSFDYQKTSINGQSTRLYGNLTRGDYYIGIMHGSFIDPLADYVLRLTQISPQNEVINGLKTLRQIRIQAPNTHLVVGDKIPLAVQGFYSDGTSAMLSSVLLTSMKPDIASISSIGEITGIADGYVQVIASMSSMIDEKEFSVGNPGTPQLSDIGNCLIVICSSDMNSEYSPTTKYLGSQIYSGFNHRRFSDQSIYFITFDQSHDINSDGQVDSVVDEHEVTVHGISNAITHWASEYQTTGPLWIYIVGIGRPEGIQVGSDEIISAESLNANLDTFQNQTQRPVVLIVDASLSSQFISQCVASSSNRVGISSTDKENAYFMHQGKLSFTQFIMDQLLAGHSVFEAWQATKSVLKNMEIPFRLMNTMLIESTKGLSTTLFPGGHINCSDQRPQIITQSPSTLISQNAQLPLFVQVSDFTTAKEVFSTVISPNFDSLTIVSGLGIMDKKIPYFNLIDPDHDQVFEGYYSSFNQTGYYRFTFYAMDTENQMAVSPVLRILVSSTILQDSDSDGMPDNWEKQYASLNPFIKDDDQDSDMDGLNNLSEYYNGTDPTDEDTDNDLILDGWEVFYQFNPLFMEDAQTDSDGDSIINYHEYIDGTDPRDKTAFIPHYGTINGQVLTQFPGYDIGLQNIKIEIAETGQHVKTDKNGRFTLTHLPFATYRLTAQSSYFQPREVYVQLMAVTYDMNPIYTLPIAWNDIHHDGIIDLSDIIYYLKMITN